MSEHLEELIVMLAKARKDAANATDLLKAAKSLFEQNPDYVALVENATVNNTLVDTLEKSIKTIALEENIDEDGACKEKHPHDAIEIKTFTVVEIPDEKAVAEWCLTKLPACLKLDKAKAERAAKQGFIPNNLAPVTTEFRAQIASDLSKYL